MLARDIAVVFVVLIATGCAERTNTSGSQRVSIHHDTPPTAQMHIDTNVSVSIDGAPGLPALGYVDVVVGARVVTQLAFRTRATEGYIGFQAVVGSDIDGLEGFANGDARSLVGQFVRFDTGGSHLRLVRGASIHLRNDHVVRLELELGSSRHVSTMEVVDTPTSVMLVEGRFSFGCGVFVPDVDSLLEGEAAAAAGTVLADPNGDSPACAEVYQRLVENDH